ncbi:hypothetical protein FNO01nite_13000 [Flavobacterium noncentrifugens]|uniref:YD repeat-containing protein n=1 Tax=Flavobacterium noncentrifugens TaxID=1128970 RepID=A0A1G8VS09_9FLAO|nr:hypothetical protein [Flavobacterium noncentrifugens]GEP50628.1 hypothetical protein FNO01nite_13000 [Flavobacterium noncentrifugens]SDJ68802.1 hypothetical protein SAMN04487935_1497 [Flavobacterium noncentrifugens]
MKTNLKKMLLLLMVTSLAVSCSDDDSSPTPIPEALPTFANKITIDTQDDSYDEVYNIIYDSEKRIGKIVSTGKLNRVYTMTYNTKNQVSAIAITGDDAKTVTATYNSDGKLTSFTNNGSATIVTYNSATQMYEGAANPFSLNAAGDIDVLGPSFIGYDNSKQGAFTSTNINYYVLSIIADATLIYIMPTKPINTISVTGQNVDIENTYTEDGHIKLFDVSDNNNPLKSFTISYEYQTL